MATKTEKVKSKLQEASEAYLAQLESTHEARACSDGEIERADRAAQIDYLKAHLDAQQNA